ncbi:MAG TPA: TadE/TadG family type IV pilus assembly protein [Bryobacteraceae bacterium]|nr:TadE/TadG family type IV pilus assembly protein [Bryobacteraceae bacterium]
MPDCKNKRRGDVMLEFTLVGIPLIFILISVVEMARGMWTYHTLAHAVKEGTRYAIVHGYNCSLAPNNCQVTVAQIAQRVREAGVGLMPNELRIELRSEGDTVLCSTLDNCLTNNNFWPVYPNSQIGQRVTINGTYPFRSAIAMFWPGAGGGMNFGTFLLPASSTETIQF